MADRPTSLDFYFDVMCPYAYQSSKWIRLVRSETGLDVRWRFFSLEEVNREAGKKHPWERAWSYGFSQMRIGALLRRDGMEVVDRWYAAVGKAFHEDARPTHVVDVQREVLAEAGFDPGLVDAALADPTTSDEVRGDHEHAVREHGAFGVPTMVLPIPGASDGAVASVYQQLVPAPDDPETAVAMFDAMVAFHRFPGLFELKHPKLNADVVTVAATFAPYLAARDWRTIENPAR